MTVNVFGAFEPGPDFYANVAPGAGWRTDGPLPDTSPSSAPPVAVEHIHPPIDWAAREEAAAYVNHLLYGPREDLL